jgi:LmbE family N-acetylglucosaminyl deacetylase
MKDVVTRSVCLPAVLVLCVLMQSGRDGTLAGETAASARVLLAVFAHPDDETVCAGVLARGATEGWNVRVIFATSGDAGNDLSGGNLKGAALGKEREREGAQAFIPFGVTPRPAPQT